MPAYKKLEEKYQLTDFKVDDKDFVKGKIGPHGVVVDRYLNIFIFGDTAETKRKWVANFLPGGFFFSAAEGKKGLVSPVFMFEDKPYFKKESAVDAGFFARATGKWEPSPFISFEDVKKALELYEKGKLDLAGYGNNKLAKERLKILRGIVEYEIEIKEAAQLFLQKERIEEHPEVVMLRKGKREVKPLNKEKAEMLTVIDLIGKNGGKATRISLLEFSKGSSGGEVIAGFADILKIGMLLRELESEGYIKTLENNEKVLTNLGRIELAAYNKRKSPYLA